MTGKAFSGVGNLTFAWVGWRKFNRKCQVSNDSFFFSGAEVANSYKHVFRQDGRVKGSDITFVSDWLPKKGLQKLCSIFEGMYEN